MPTHRYDDLIPWDIEAAAWEALDSDEAARAAWPVEGRGLRVGPLEGEATR
jgi:hypothetical protein